MTFAAGAPIGGDPRDLASAKIKDFCILAEFVMAIGGCGSTPAASKSPAASSCPKRSTRCIVPTRSLTSAMPTSWTYRSTATSNEGTPRFALASGMGMAGRH